MDPDRPRPETSPGTYDSGKDRGFAFPLMIKTKKGGRGADRHPRATSRSVWGISFNL